MEEAGKRVLLFGDMNSVWLFRYIRKMYLKNYSITVIDMSSARLPKGDEYYQFCQEKGISIVGIYNDTKYARCMKYISIIKNMPSFDICHVMYASGETSLIVRLCSSNLKKIIVNFWGSDFYRADSNLQHEQKYLLDIADTIIVPTKKMEEKVVERYPQFRDNIYTVYFESPKIEMLQNELETGAAFPFSEKLGEKIVVAVGYNGFKEQQHEMLLRAINQCDTCIRDRIVVILVMSYGLLPEYEAHMDACLENVEFDCFVIKEYMTDEEMVNLRKVIDVYINGRITDAYNAALQESMYCQSVILNGSWLSYPELENRKAYIMTFSSETDLTEKFTEVINNLAYYKEQSLKNRMIMKNALAERENVEDWHSLYKLPCRNNINRNNDDVWKYVLDKQQCSLNRRVMYDKVLEKWLNTLLGGICPIKRYVCENGYTRVVIYGAGTLGEKVFKELQRMDIDIILCDKNEMYVPWFEGNILKPDELKNIEIELIIVTPIHLYSSIVESLPMNEGSSVISLMDLLN